MELSEHLVLLCKGGKKVVFPAEYIPMNETLCAMVEGVEELEPVKFNWDEKVVKILITFCEMHINNPVDLNCDEISQKDYNFANKVFANSEEEFAQLTNLADYIDNKQLSYICCYYLRDYINGKSIDEIRKKFNLTDDRTKEQIEETNTANGWIKDGDVEIKSRDEIINQERMRSFLKYKRRKK